jgi:UDP-N-acetyl-D-mannosaminuronate dehydrogenase
MNDFRHRLLSTRRVSVWGIGFLGYTSLLRLQSKGFAADAYDFDHERMKALLSGRYPTQRHKESWSFNGSIHALDLSKVTALTRIDKMFRNCLHIISFPGAGEVGTENKLADLADYFVKYKKELTDGLVMFQSAGPPGDIQKNFIDRMIDAGIICSYVSAFRTDWSVEEFFIDSKRQVIAGYDDRSFQKARIFFNLFGIEHVALSNIEEAEIYECARKSLQYTISSFVNQLVMGYPNSDVRRMVALLLRDIQFDDTYPSIGAIGYKSASAIGHLLEGSVRPDRLTMVQDAESTNLSTILFYAELIKRAAPHQITIFGICEKGDQKDIRLSPSRVLAEKLIQEGMNVLVHDPYFTAQEIVELIPGASFNDLTRQSSKSDCIVLMSDHRVYSFLNQTDLDQMGATSAKLVIDNIGLWKDYRFSKHTVYHIPGDGKLGRLE